MILITGANGGIGQHVLRHLLLRGEREILCHFRADSTLVDATLREFGLDPSRHAYRADLTSESSVGEMAERIVSEHGGVTRLVNVAGSSTNGMSWKLSKAEFMQVLEDSLLTTFLCCKAFVPAMRENRFGRVVNVSSIVAFTGAAGVSHYSAAKAGLVGFTKSLSIELAGRGITANAVALGYFNTGLINTISQPIQDNIRKQIPLGRFGEQQDVGAAVAYLLGQDAGFTTGQVLHINGGQY